MADPAGTGLRLVAEQAYAPGVEGCLCVADLQTWQFGGDVPVVAGSGRVL